MGAALAFLDGGGFMGALMKRHDWSRSPLGAPENWPDTLKTAIATCLGSRFPMVVWWGPQLCMLYNDAWQPILGDTKHPQGLGQPGQESWPETWAIVEKQFEDALRGMASWSEDLLLASDRQGFMQECYFTYSHSPLRDSNGEVVGVYSAVSETTAHVLAERRLGKLRDLSAAAIAAAEQRRDTDEACQDSVRMLCTGNPDAPFAILNVVEAGDALRLCAVHGIDETRFLAGGDDWLVRRAIESGQPQAGPLVGAEVRSPPWPEPVRQVVSVPLRSEHERSRTIGVLTVGVNSRLSLDDAYLDFLQLVAAQIAGSISALRSIEKETRAAQVKEMLIAELQHRTRNLLGIVQSISNRTVEASHSLAEFRTEFGHRLAALSRIQGVLSRGEDTPIELDELVRLELAPLTGAVRERVSVTGQRVVLPRPVVQVLALTLHELTTNALKHGALNGPDGNLSISWEEKRMTNQAVLRLNWVERWDRDIAPPASKTGFGRTLIEQAIPRQIDGRTEFTLGRNGLDCAIEIPL